MGYSMILSTEPAWKVLEGFLEEVIDVLGLEG